MTHHHTYHHNHAGGKPRHAVSNYGPRRKFEKRTFDTRESVHLFPSLLAPPSFDMWSQGLRPLIAALSVNDKTCQRFGSLGIGNLATNIANQVKIVQEGAVHPLVALVGDTHKDAEARRYATLAIANLASTVGNHPALIEEGALHAMFSLSNSPDVQSQYYVAYSLANLAANERTHHQMVMEGGLQYVASRCIMRNEFVHFIVLSPKLKIPTFTAINRPLIALSYSSSADVQHQSAAALRGLAVNDANKMKSESGYGH